MDVVALYPSILKEMAKDAIKKAIIKSGMKWENINVKHLCRHVAMTIPRNVIRKEGLDKVVPVPRTKTTLHSFINPKDNAKETDGDNQFHNPENDDPNEIEVRKLIGLFIGSSVEVVP